MSSQSSALQPGSHVGELQINAILGVGAFAITYLVTDPAIGTRFALKEYMPAKLAKRQQDGRVLPADKASEALFASGIKTFLVEARMTAALDHPNIVKVLRYFEANGTAYYLMPYYQGQALHHLLEADGPLNREAARALMLTYFWARHIAIPICTSTLELSNSAAFLYSLYAMPYSLA